MIRVSGVITPTTTPPRTSAGDVGGTIQEPTTYYQYTVDDPNAVKAIVTAGAAPARSPADPTAEPAQRAGGEQSALSSWMVGVEPSVRNGGVNGR
jgi:hypothetical protein